MAVNFLSWWAGDRLITVNEVSLFLNSTQSPSFMRGLLNASASFLGEQLALPGQRREELVLLGAPAVAFAAVGAGGDDSDSGTVGCE
jgi:hypothetical protein